MSHGGWLRALAPAAALWLWSSGCKHTPVAPVAPVAKALWYDIAASSGLNFAHRSGAVKEINILQGTGSGCGWIDYDGDGWQDAILVQGEGGGSRLFHNRQGTGFEDVTAGAGLHQSGFGMGCAVGDYDGDGRPDLYFCNYGANQLYHNQGDGTFREVTEAAGVGLKGWSVSAVFFDADGDGDEDLFVVRYVHFTAADPQLCTANGIPSACPPRNYNAEPDVFYRNEGGGRFRDATAEAGFHDANGRGLGVMPVDFDADGDLDLFVANDGTANSLWINDGRGRFTDRAAEKGCAFDAAGKSAASMGCDWGDVNGDGRPDLVVGTFQNETTSLFLNRGGSLAYASSESGLVEPTLPLLTFGLGLLDWDNDGDLDLIQANGHIQDRIAEIDPDCVFAQPRQLLVNDGAGRFTVLEGAQGGPALSEPRVGRGLAVADWDNDGRLDVLINNLGGPPMLLSNQGPRRHWLTLDLRDGKGRPVGEGAWARCTSGDRTWTRYTTRAAGYAGSRDPRLHFGLGDAAGPCAVEVGWPGGTRSRVERILPDRVMTLRQKER